MKACQGRLKFECLRSLKLYRTAGCLDAWVIGAEGAADLLTFQLEWSSVTLTDKTGVTDELRVVEGLPKAILGIREPIRVTAIATPLWPSLGNRRAAAQVDG